MGVTFDDSDFRNKVKKLEETLNERKKKAVHDVASAILLISQSEVPHDKGTLQNSGHVEDLEDESLVGYNMVYAARLHEHPEYHFQKGRKGKYLEDPLKNHIDEWRNYFKKILSG